MLLQILAHTPAWVFALFALLLWMGITQLFPRRASLARITVMPVVMTALAVYGVVSAFADTPWALAAWATMALLVGAATLLLAPASTAQNQPHYNPQTRSFSLPGSGVPLALMMGIFTTKYAVGVALSLHPALEHDTLVALGISTLYGVFSGSFIARARRLWRLALAAHAAQTAAYAQ